MIRLTAVPPFSLLSWRGGFNPVFLLFCAIIIGLNGFVPARWIESSATAIGYAELVREKLLNISPYADIWAHARTTLFPRAALFSHAVTWSLIVLVGVHDFLLVAFNSRAWTRYFRATVWGPAPPKKRAILIASGLFFLVGAWTTTMMPGSMEHTASADLRSRAFFGFLSACMFTIGHMVAFTYSVMFFALIVHRREREKP